MQTNSKDIWKKDLKLFREKTADFYNGNMNKADYKHFSGIYGSYAQRDRNANMLRLRLTGGRITREKMKFICQCIETYQLNLIHLTTCQTIQFHNLEPLAVSEIMEKALDCGIVTMGGGGDYPRNIMVSPLSGVEPKEAFDVLPYALAAEQYVLSFIQETKMPRKLKIGFSNGVSNDTHVTFRDLGFLACPDGTFDVYSAGGLGKNPRLGLKVADHISPSDILYHIRAMRDLFNAHGNYKNRAKARTRYMQETLGEEGYIKAYRETLSRVYSSGRDLHLSPAPLEVRKTGSLIPAAGERILHQKQPGLYAVSYHPIGGCPSPENFVKLCAFIEKIEAAELRLTPDEGMYIINLTGDEALKVAKATEDSAKSALQSSVACIGASICQIGLRDSQKLLREIIKALREAKTPEHLLPQIHVSGCPSSCGTHQIGVLGLHGCVKVLDKHPIPAFTLHIAGCEKTKMETFGTPIGMIAQERIPAFMIELARRLSALGLDLSGKESLNHEETRLICDTAEAYLL